MVDQDGGTGVEIRIGRTVGAVAVFAYLDGQPVACCEMHPALDPAGFADLLELHLTERAAAGRVALAASARTAPPAADGSRPLMQLMA